MFVVTWLIHTSRVDINAWICVAIPVNWFCMIFMMIVFSCKFARILEHCLEPIYCYLSWQFQRICTALPWTFMKRKNLSSLVIYFSLVWAAFIANTDSEYGSSNVGSDDSFNLFLFTFYLFDNHDKEWYQCGPGGISDDISAKSGFTYLE